MTNFVEYSEIADTSCGSSIFAAGSTIYELSGVDLAPRVSEVVSMTADDFSFSEYPVADDCYR